MRRTTYRSLAAQFALLSCLATGCAAGASSVPAPTEGQVSEPSTTSPFKEAPTWGDGEGGAGGGNNTGLTPQYTATQAPSCVNHCGASAGSCQCDPGCSARQDCCSDYAAACPPVVAQPTNTCQGHCGAQAPGGCYCDAACTQSNDCCPDFTALCGGTLPPPASCVGYCGGSSPGGCACDGLCMLSGTCCSDFSQVCEIAIGF